MSIEENQGRDILVVTKGEVEIIPNKRIVVPLVSFFFFLILIKPVFAHCPLCTVATGAVVATARWYGVDDLIVGTFFGGFTISTAFWINRILLKRNKGRNYIPFQLVIITLLSLILNIITLQTAGLFSNFTLFGVDRLVVGTLIGSFVTLVAFGFHNFIRKTNGNKNFLPFQVIVISLVFLLLSVFGYYLARLII